MVTQKSKDLSAFMNALRHLFTVHFLLRLCEFEMLSGNNNSSWLGANGSPLCWFCLVLFQWFLLSERMSAVCARPSLSTLHVISSTWSLRYLLSSTMLPSRCSATWNARLTSSLKPSWNCGLKRCRLFLSSLPFSHKCRSHKKIPPLRWRLLLLLLSRLENQQFKLERHHSSFCLFSCCLQFTSALQANKLSGQTQLLKMVWTSYILLIGIKEQTKKTSSVLPILHTNI